MSDGLDEIEDQVANLKALLIKRKAESERLNRRSGRKISTLYLIEQMNGGAVKIGISSSPRRRLATLQTGSDKTLALINFTALWLEDAVKIEKQIHDRFRRSAIHASGEWYNCDYKFAVNIIEETIWKEKGPDFQPWRSSREELDNWFDGK